MKRWLVVAGLSVAAAVGCADHRGPQVSGDPSRPGLGWVIMYGHDDNPDEEFGCQSNPRSECAVLASSPGRRTLSEVHLYFHAAKTEATKYSGTVKIGFFTSAPTSSGLKVDANVNPGDVGNHSVVGVVTDKPGRYTMSIDVVAVTQSGIEEHIREDVPVDVQPRASVTNGN